MYCGDINHGDINHGTEYCNKYKSKIPQIPPHQHNDHIHHQSRKG